MAVFTVLVILCGEQINTQIQGRAAFFSVHEQISQFVVTYIFVKRVVPVSKHSSFMFNIHTVH